MLPGNLALDAPLVAASWWFVFAAGFGKPPDWRVFFSLIPAVWAIYLFDRLCDAASLTDHLPARKQFARDHPILLRAMLGLALLWAGEAALFLPVPVWWQIGAIGAATGVYFFRNHWEFPFNLVPAKEALIAFCFAAGVGLPFLKPVSGQMLGALGLFGILCFLNCLIISQGESSYDAATDPLAWFSKSERHFPFLPSFVGHFIASLILLSCGLPLIPGFCLLGSNILLFLIHFSTPKSCQPMVPALCDAALWLPGAIGAFLLAQQSFQG